MKPLKQLCFLIIAYTLVSCNNQQSDVEQWKKEIIEVEAEFAKMADEKGIPAAFLAFSDESVVLLRNNKLTIGKDALRAKYSDLSYDPNVKLTWKPDFVDVSSSGDLAYTYGKYTYSEVDSTGNVEQNEGIFHTIWKRQPDGTWKFVWD